MDLDFTDLTLFLHVVEAGSITGGARRAHLSLASASARIRNLEERLRVSLFVRGRTGVAPTPAGHELLRHARAVTSRMEELRGSLGPFAGGSRGSVRLECNTAALTEHLPEPLGAFLAANPHIDVDLDERPSRDIVRRVRDGSAQVGVVSDAADLSGLEAYPFREDRLVLAVRAGHVLAGRRSAVFAEALDHPFICLTRESALQQYLEVRARESGKRFAARVRVRTFDAVCRMAARGVGIGVVPASAAREAGMPGLAVVRLSDAWAGRRLLVCVKRLSDLPEHARRLVAALTA